MLKKVILENFQAHEHSEIEFSEGINVICGASDQGKSSVIRAIRWVLENRPSGFAFKREGSKGATRVTLIFDSGKIIKTRSETENSYKVYALDKPPVEFKALRTDVPEEVKAVAQFGPYNVQYQFGTSFLLDDSPGDVAKKLNSLSGVSIIDDILKETNSRVRAEKAKETATSELLANLKKTKAGFKNLKKLEKLVLEAEKLDEEIKEFKGYSYTLSNHIANLKRLIAIPVVDVQSASSLLVKTRTLSKDYEEYMEASYILKNHLATFSKIAKQLEACCDHKAVGHLIQQAKDALPRLAALRIRASKLESHLAKLKTGEAGFKAATANIKRLATEIVQFKTEHKVCPVCNKKW